MKIHTSVLHSCLALSLAGCGAAGPPDSASGDRVLGTTLVLAIPNSSEGDSLRTAAVEYGRSRDVSIDIVQAPYSNLFEKIANSCRAGSDTYDLVLVDDPWFTFLIENGCFRELTSMFEARGESGPDSDFVTRSLDLCRHPYAEGPFYCLPYVGNAQMFFYNAEIFAEYGMTSAPQTWDEALEVMREITRAGDGRLYGYALRGQEGNPVVANFMPIFWSFGGRMFDAHGRPQVDSAEGIAALELFLELKETSPPGSESFNADELGTYLLQGGAAAAINWPNWVATFEDPEQSRVVGKMAYGRIPAGTRPGSSEIGHWLLAVSGHSSHPEEAFEFLSWATSREQMTLSAERGNSPVRESVFSDPALTSQERFRHFPILMQVIQSSTPRPRHARWPEIENAFGVELSKAVAGLVEPREALERANEEIRRIVER